MSIEIRALYALSDMYAAVELQRTYWGDDVESVIPAHMLFSLANNGGHVLVAEDDGHMVGVLIGFIGTDNEYDRPALANLHMVSKRMVILPEYRNQGIAYRLKLAQRERTIEQGIRLITWTFDPLLAANAHLNIRKLGAVCPRFLENYYGTGDAGGLTTLGISDRLLVEWWVTHRRVKARIEDERGNLGLQQYLDAEVPILNPARVDAVGLLRPAAQALEAGSAMVLVEIPRDFNAILKHDTGVALDWRWHVRALLQGLLRANYVVTDFVSATTDAPDRVFYVLSQTGSDFRFSHN
jgi:chorismate synthase